jgi:thioredoxin-like negative regulator of GroEL
VFHELATKHHEFATFAKVDIDDAKDVAEHCQVVAIPQLHVMKGNELLEKCTIASEGWLREVVAKHIKAN